MPDGILDHTLGGDGKVTTAIGTWAYGTAVAIQPNGRILVAGDAAVGRYTRFALSRYKPDGTLDTSFGGGDGKVTTAWPIGTSAYGDAIAIQPDGRIVVAGVAGTLVGNESWFALARYKPNGTLDSTFGDHGKLITPVGVMAASAAVAIQPDARIVVAGDALVGESDRFALARYKHDGALDKTFGGDGKVTTPIGTRAFGADVAIQTDGLIVVAGEASSENSGRFALARYKPNGTLDRTFGGGGKVTTRIGTSAEGAGIAMQPDDRIVVAGDATVGGTKQFALARYLDT